MGSFKHLIFKAKFKRFSVFFPKHELENHDLFEGLEGWGVAYNVLKSVLSGRKGSH